jgi:hypothetical protein
VSVKLIQSGAGDYSIGAEIEGAFVPFLTLSAGRVSQLVQRGHDLQERAEQGDERARDLLGEAQKQKSSRSKSKSEPEEES